MNIKMNIASAGNTNQYTSGNKPLNIVLVVEPIAYIKAVVVASIFKTKIQSRSFLF